MSCSVLGVLVIMCVALRVRFAWEKVQQAKEAQAAAEADAAAGVAPGVAVGGGFGSSFDGIEPASGAATERALNTARSTASGGHTARSFCGSSTARSASLSPRGSVPRGTLLEPDFVIAARAATPRDQRLRPLPAGMADPQGGIGAHPSPSMPGPFARCPVHPMPFPPAPASCGYGGYGGYGCNGAATHRPMASVYGGFDHAASAMPNHAATFRGCGVPPSAGYAPNCFQAPMPFPGVDPCAFQGMTSAHAQAQPFSFGMPHAPSGLHPHLPHPAAREAQPPSAEWPSPDPSLGAWPSPGTPQSASFHRSPAGMHVDDAASEVSSAWPEVASPPSRVNGATARTLDVDDAKPEQFL